MLKFIIFIQKYVEIFYLLFLFRNMLKFFIFILKYVEIYYFYSEICWNLLFLFRNMLKFVIFIQKYVEIFHFSFTRRYKDFEFYKITITYDFKKHSKTLINVKYILQRCRERGCANASFEYLYYLEQSDVIDYGSIFW